MLSLSSRQSRISFLCGLWLGPCNYGCHGFTRHSNCAGIARDWRESGGDGGPQGFPGGGDPPRRAGAEGHSRAGAAGEGQRGEKLDRGLRSRVPS